MANRDHTLTGPAASIGAQSLPCKTKRRQLRCKRQVQRAIQYNDMLKINRTMLCFDVLIHSKWYERERTCFPGAHRDDTGGFDKVETCQSVCSNGSCECPRPTPTVKIPNLRSLVADDGPNPSYLGSRRLACGQWRRLIVTIEAYITKLCMAFFTYSKDALMLVGIGRHRTKGWATSLQAMFVRAWFIYKGAEETSLHLHNN